MGQNLVMPIDSFLKNIAKGLSEDDCWAWQGWKTRAGYGQFTVTKKRYYAHRFAYEHYYSVEPGKLFVCHHCDNPECCNPKHLFLGTYQDNHNDMTRKGRRAKGETIAQSKLTEKQVLEIYKQKGLIFSSKLAPLYGVTPANICCIWRGETWSHVTGAKRRETPATVHDCSTSN